MIGIAAEGRELNWWDDLPDTAAPPPIDPREALRRRIERAVDMLAFCRLAAGERIDLAIERLLARMHDRLRSISADGERAVIVIKLGAVRRGLDQFDWRSLEPQAWDHIKNCDNEIAELTRDLERTVE